MTIYVSSRVDLFTITPILMFFKHVVQCVVLQKEYLHPVFK